MAANPQLPPELVREFVIAAHGSLDKVTTMLEQEPALLNAQFEWSPDDFEDGLGAASHVGNRAIAEFLLSKGAPLNICTAAMLGRMEDVSVFLRLNPSLANARGAHGIPVMFHAAMSGNTIITAMLQGSGCNEGIPFALHGAIAYGHKDMVRWLLDHGAKADVQIKNFENKTPLQKATELGYPEIADLLKQAGAAE
jgi:ankyrin repeat protein